MPKFDDENRVTWDIRTTSVQAGSQPIRQSWFAAVDEDSTADYSGNKFPLDNEETFSPGGVDARITWPANGNPIIRGAGNEDDATATIKLFAARNKGRLDIIVLRVKEKGSGGGIIVLLLLGALVFAESRKRRR